AVSRYHDELWALVPGDRGPAPRHLLDFVRGLPPARRALDLGGGDGRLGAELAADELTVADVSAAALERARGRLPGAHLVQLEPACRPAPPAVRPPPPRGVSRPRFRPSCFAQRGPAPAPPPASSPPGPGAPGAGGGRSRSRPRPTAGSRVSRCWRGVSSAGSI